MRIVVDRNVCIGAASCVAIAAHTFGLDMEGKAEVILVQDKRQTAEESSGMSTPQNDVRETILEAAESCPVRAIKILEDDGTVLWQ